MPEHGSEAARRAFLESMTPEQRNAFNTRLFLFRAEWEQRARDDLTRAQSSLSADITDLGHMGVSLQEIEQFEEFGKEGIAAQKKAMDGVLKAVSDTLAELGMSVSED